MISSELIGRVEEETSHFVELARIAPSGREAADWALAARNMASVLHSLVGAAATDRRERAPRVGRGLDANFGHVPTSHPATGSGL